MDVFTPVERERNLGNIFGGHYATIYEVGYENSEKKKNVAIQCDTQPVMYLRLVAPDDRSNTLVAMFLRHEVNPSKSFPARK